MNGPVIVDSNLLLLLIAGIANRDYIAKHKKLADDYSEYDFDLLTLLIAEFSDILLVPHVLAEVSSLARQIKNPARREIQTKLRELIETTTEVHIESLYGALREEFDALGLTDSVLLHFCTLKFAGVDCTLLTADEDLAFTASSLGYGVIYYDEFISQP